jgi:hypothetical protein
MKKKVLLLLIPFLVIPVVVFSFQLMQMSFNSGELSPRLFGRVDLSKYYSGLETCLNAVVMPLGGVTRRSGFEFIATAEQTTTETILVPFEFSTEQAYILELGDETMRAYADGGQVLVADSETKLLLYMDGVEGSVDFVDSSVDPKTTTVFSGAQVKTSQKKFGTGSAFFDGVDDFLFTADSDDWFMDTGNFTIDFWVRFNSAMSATGVNGGIFQQYQDLNNNTAIRAYEDGGSYYVGIMIYENGGETVDVYTEIPSFATETWYHVAVVRGHGGNANDWAVAVDGTFGTAVTDADDWPQWGARVDIGTSNWPGGQAIYQNGFLDEFRISKGVARWTDDFTPPTRQYPTGTADGDVYKLTSPFEDGHLTNLKFVQSADVLYFAHNSYPPYKLLRNNHTSWEFIEMDFDWPPFQDINTTTTTLNPSGTTGVITITSSQSNLITTDEVGTYVMFGGNGYAKIASATNETVAIATVEETLPAAGATTDWYLSSWGGDNGYPGAVSFFEERLVYAGSVGEPQTIWMSQTGDFENHFVSTGEVADSDALQYTISADQVNAIKWLVSTKKLLIGTVGGEWWMSGSETTDPISPTNAITRRETTYGSQGLQPVTIDNSVLFLQRGGKKIRGFSYDFEADAYLGSDLSLLSDFTRNNEIRSMTYQQYPYQVVWNVRDDGDLLGLTYMKAQEIIGWHHHTTNGDFKWVATIPGDNEDELWAVVKRTIDGTDIVTIERMYETFDGDDMSDAFYVDSGLTYDGSEATTLTGLDHLAGATVEVLADGLVQDATLVQASGAIGLNPGASKASVGLRYLTDIKTLRLAGGETGELQGRQKHISFATLRLFETLGISMGTASTALDDFQFAATDELYTGDKKFSFLSEVGAEGQMFIRQTNPQPMTILSIIPEFEVYD